ALAFLQGGTPAMCAHAAAMTFKSVLGLACDPVGGLVECPCIKRNGILVANGTLCADMALAGIESVIPLDEVIDSMGQIGRMMAPALRETSQGGLAVTPAAAELMRDRTDRIGG
ncbi:L-serine ammonia-lyase, iron-sulfur-dependent, subunit beta, partial [Cloacibacillus evryensis]|uniref:L-serine ammonia-lyase, iron-sulfur-dependent, subunit beta n=1 Tax=Cloacibacillus evryensis TaxID=508460 RepID=UPI00241F7541